MSARTLRTLLTSVLLSGGCWAQSSVPLISSPQRRRTPEDRRQRLSGRIILT
jgi:hypothetical protein